MDNRTKTNHPFGEGPFKAYPRFFFCLSVLLALAFPKAASAEKSAYAEWCQCAIFVVNHLGLEIIPGEYYTAGSFATPDESGQTWMEYQGFSRRAAGENPQNGDVVVIRPYGRVLVPESGEGSRLVEANAAWTGHIGVVESSEIAKMDGKDYWQLTFMSSNWGVNASPMFVRSNCFNVDRSLIWVEKSDPDFSFWQPTNPSFQRQHILNIGRQLANGYYHIGFDGTIDGYPVSGDGMIAYLWNLDFQPDRPIEEILIANGVEVSSGSIQTGDALVLSSEQGESFRGIFAGEDDRDGGWFKTGLAYWFDPASAVLKGPVRLADLLTPEQAGRVRIFRSNGIAPDLKVDGFEVLEGKDSKVKAAYIIRNEGGQTIKIEMASVRINSPQGLLDNDADVKTINGIEITPGQEFVFIGDILVVKSGVYQLQPEIMIDGKNMFFPDLQKVQYISAGDL